MPVLDPPPGRRSVAMQGFRRRLSTCAFQIEGAERSGLVHVDQAFQQGIPSDSARWYGAIARRSRP